jgi:chaperonin GroEL (HSP60 family)
VASISAGNDDSVGEMIADALDKVGSNGVLSIESSSSIDTFVEVTEGMEIDRGYISPQFVTNQERLLADYDNCKVLVTDQKVRAGGSEVTTGCVGGGVCLLEQQGWCWLSTTTARCW